MLSEMQRRLKVNIIEYNLTDRTQVSDVAFGQAIIDCVYFRQLSAGAIEDRYNRVWLHYEPNLKDWQERLVEIECDALDMLIARRSEDVEGWLDEIEEGNIEHTMWITPESRDGQAFYLGGNDMFAYAMGACIANMMKCEELPSFLI